MLSDWRFAISAPSVLGSAPLFEFGRRQQSLDRLNRLKNPFTMPGKIVLMPLLDLGQPLAYVKIETLGVLNTQHRTDDQLPRRPESNQSLIEGNV